MSAGHPDDPAELSADAASSMQRAMMLRGNESLEAALVAGKRAVALYERAASEGPGYRLALAVALVDLSFTYRDAGQHDRSLVASRDAVGRVDGLETSDDRRRDLVAQVHLNLAVDCSHFDLHEEAIEQERHAVAIYESLTAAGGLYQVDLVDALERLTKSYARAGRDSEGIAAFVRLSEARAAMPVKSAEQRDVALSGLTTLHRECEQRGENRKAAAIADRAIALVDPYAEFPKPRALIYWLWRLAFDCSRDGQDERALEAAQQSVDVAEQLASDGDTGHRDLGNALFVLGVIYNRSRQPDSAMYHARRAVELLELRGEPAQPVVERDLAVALSALAWTHSGLDQHGDALACARRSVDLLVPIAEENGYGRDLAIALRRLGVSMGKLGQHGDGRAALLQSLALLEREPADRVPAQDDIAQALEDLATAERISGDASAASGFAVRAVEIYEGLCRRDIIYADGLATSLLRLAEARVAIGDHRGSLEPTARAAAILRRRMAARPAVARAPLVSTLVLLAHTLATLGQGESASAIEQEADRWRRSPPSG